MFCFPSSLWCLTRPSSQYTIEYQQKKRERNQSKEGGREECCQFESVWWGAFYRYQHIPSPCDDCISLCQCPWFPLTSKIELWKLIRNCKHNKWDKGKFSWYFHKKMAQRTEASWNRLISDEITFWWQFQLRAEYARRKIYRRVWLGGERPTKLYM